MKHRHMSAKDVLHTQEYTRAAAQVCLLITLGILWERFNATETQMKNFYHYYREELKNYRIWTEADCKKAEMKFREKAKRYTVEFHADEKNVGIGGWKENHRIIISETTCLYIALYLLRVEFGANYEQLDAFGDLYTEFCQIYGEGGQTTMTQLSEELSEIIGVNIVKP